MRASAFRLALAHLALCVLRMMTADWGVWATTSTGCIDDWIGDGWCDSGNNNAACDYDGGDCCECTCVDGPNYECGVNADYDCQDPTVDCVGPSSDTCSPNPCENGGTCTVDASGCHVCSCPTGYGGMQCQTSTTGLASFSIVVDFVGTWTTSRMAVFQSAADRWAEVITHTPCGNGSLAVTAELTNIDGVGSTLGYAGPSYIWATCPSISVSGEMVFDIDDIADLEADGIFEGVILHEMGHCIGIGTLWEPPYGSCSSCSTDGSSTWMCPAAVTVYNELLGNPGGTEADIIELGGGGGTMCSHLDEDIFGGEIMTGYVDDVMYLSKMTTGCLDDNSYVVDATQADEYSLPGTDAAYAAGLDVASSKRKLDQRNYNTTLKLVDDDGKVVGIRPGVGIAF